MRDGMDILTNIGGKIQIDINKIRNYRDSKTITDRLKTENIPNLIKADGIMDEAVLTTIKPALLGNAALTTQLATANQTITDARVYLNNIPNLTQASLQQFKDAHANLPTVQAQLTTLQGNHTTLQANYTTSQTNLTNAGTTITNAQTHLGIADLNILPNMNGKTLDQTITEMNVSHVVINNARTHLGIANLTTALPNMGGKTLAELIADSNAHATCGGNCPNPAHHVNYNTV